MRNLNIIAILMVMSLLFASCGGKNTPAANGEAPKSMLGPKTENEKMIADGRGIGEVKSVTLNTPLEQERVKRGQDIYDMKCSACHKLTDERFVGPGWKGVTSRRKPEWIMNMVTNVDVMLERDAEAQKLLELCLTRMPNQNVSIGDARDILEFMRSNDGEK
ncbi:MAG TPA: c-type cytochrome [Chitinophagales bacterium]|nr:cytochrome c [Chitinophagales bacterium]HMU68920.1 c-type cytochrome [Chitinophagales bacterium]HNA56842.1 c-type cytochrome [Chitinophagales bacterium]HNE46817.1 c-type cytochrome [Chitinophagales bacterium]HNF69019.1 c-type cytochrome [Chitinophagales bacterium]